MSVNRIKVNKMKTKAMIITTKYKYNNINLNNSIDKKKIEFVTNIEYLGFQLVNFLTFERNFRYMYGKNCKKCIFSRMKFASNTGGTFYFICVYWCCLYCLLLIKRFSF